MSNQNGLLKKIQVRGFKSIKELDLDLAPLNVIVGPNGIGKSNFINIFKFLYNVVNKDLQTFVALNGGAERFLHLGSKNTNEMKFKLSFQLNDYVLDLVPTNFNTFIFKNEQVCYKGNCTTLSSPDKLETALHYSNAYRIQYILEYLEGLRVYHFHDTSDTSLIKKYCSVNNQRFLLANGENIAAMLYRFKNNYKENYDRIVKSVQVVAPFFHDFILEPDDKGNIMLRWKQIGSDNAFDATYLSDGTLRFIALATLLLQPLDFIPSTLLIDEPELGLHPYALKILAELMKSVARQGKQIIATSQSVTFINEFNYDEIIVADRKGNESSFRRLEEKGVKNWVDLFSMGDIWERNIIGGHPNDF